MLVAGLSSTWSLFLLSRPDCRPFHTGSMHARSSMLRHLLVCYVIPFPSSKSVGTPEYISLHKFKAIINRILKNVIYYIATMHIALLLDLVHSVSTRRVQHQTHIHHVILTFTCIYLYLMEFATSWWLAHEAIPLTIGERSDRHGTQALRNYP